MSIGGGLPLAEYNSMYQAKQNSLVNDYTDQENSMVNGDGWPIETDISRHPRPSFRFRSDRVAFAIL